MQSRVPCLYLEAFHAGQAPLGVAGTHGLEGVVSKRRSAPYRSGESQDGCVGGGEPGAVAVV
jgi:ATP-dependent DNA ligase